MKQWQKNEFWDTWWDKEAFNDWKPEVEEVPVIERVKTQMQLMKKNCLKY